MRRGRREVVASRELADRSRTLDYARKVLVTFQVAEAAHHLEGDGYTLELITWKVMATMEMRGPR